MKNVILHFQNEQTDKHTSITITQEQLRQFALGSVQTKWTMKHGQNQPISVFRRRFYPKRLRDRM